MAFRYKGMIDMHCIWKHKEFDSDKRFSFASGWKEAMELKLDRDKEDGAENILYHKK